jgi:hypothetical protein
LNIEADFFVAFARTIASVAFSSLLIHWEKLKPKAIMKNIFICIVGGVALAERKALTENKFSK